MVENNSQQLRDEKGKPYHRSAILALILLATFAGTLMQTSLGTALPTLMKGFDIDLATAQQATTWFLLANGVMVPISAYLATRFSTKWLHFVSYGMLLVGIGMSYFTPENSNSWWIFLVGRILAAMAVGIMMPLMQVLILNMFPREQRALAMGISGLVVSMAPAIGPTLSGWILDKNHIVLGITITNSWRNIFVIPLIIIAIAFVLSPFLMKDIIPSKNVKLDVWSLILSCVGFCLFLLGFTNVADNGWGDMKTVILPIIVGLLILIVFIWRQTRLEVPFLDVRVFLNKNFTLPSIALILVTMAMYGVEMMLPTYLQNIHHMSPFESGLTLLAGALTVGLMSPISGSLYNKVGIKRMTFVGFLVLAAGTLPFVFLSSSTPTILITVLYAVRMGGVAIVMMPLTTSAMDALPTEKSTDGTAANNTLRQVSSSIVVAVLTSMTQNVINNNTPSHHFQKADPMAYTQHVLSASMDGFQLAFLTGLIFAVLGIFFVIFLKNEKAGDR
ncbi:MDR family MFS transporter [Bombilactobacillus thymidiniphilus]|uniref:Multidrug efflux MFS transporter n=1 Tax=Bombilactobacillus thymidiniphilus TaxID=2923363 RepID=A0ABY4PDR8_9LACO|nr:MDR family MFS transporter [Bombilactobacillus thymidiniphilus]UQS83677.1 multidrug efflux MFS transporter [Bombilactobacillus thymidiniphilus]